MEQHRAVPDEIEVALSKAAAEAPQAAATQLVAAAHRAAAMLHGLANREAKRCKGTADWPKWARLTNAARALVLQASSCRDAAKDL